jgi:hypothetical protein
MLKDHVRDVATYFLFIYTITKRSNISISRLFQMHAEKAVVAQLVKTFPNFMKPECSLPCSKSPPLDYILRQMNPIDYVISHSLKIHFNVFLIPTLTSISGLFPSGFPIKRNSYKTRVNDKLFSNLPHQLRTIHSVKKFNILPTHS